MNKKLLVTAAVLTTLGGVSVVADESVELPLPSVSAQSKAGKYLSTDKVKEIAAKEAGVSVEQAAFEEVEFDMDDGVPHYEVEFHVEGREYDYDIHAESGKLLDREVENNDDRRDRKNKTAVEQKSTKKAREKTQLSTEQAKQIAFRHAEVEASQAYVEEVELDEEDGRLVFEMEFKAGAMEYEVDIDAYSGEILDFEQEYND